MMGLSILNSEIPRGPLIQRHPIITEIKQLEDCTERCNVFFFDTSHRESDT